MTTPERVALVSALTAGILIGIADTRAEEVQPAVLLLLVAGAGLGGLAPRVALPSAILLGLGVPIVHAYVRMNHLPLPYLTDGYAGSFLALIPATIGVVAGALLRRFTASA